jgi:hypothetical protein
MLLLLLLSSAVACQQIPSVTQLTSTPPLDVLPPRQLAACVADCTCMKTACAADGTCQMYRMLGA